MAGPYVDGLERALLCDLLQALGPEAATVLKPWTTRDLAAHLFLRERDPFAGPGLAIPGPWARFAERKRKEATRRDFSELIATIRSGPTGVFRLGWLRRVPNLNEFFIHHEDVRRANGGTRRVLDQTMNDALWANASDWAWYLARRLSGPGLELQNGVTGETARARGGRRTVSLAGDPGELLLFLFGRQSVAEVVFDGPVESIKTVTQAKFGL